MGRSEDSDEPDGDGWLLETIRVTQRLISTASSAREIGTELPAEVSQVAPTRVAWIGQPHPDGGIRVRSSSDALPDHFECSEGTTRTVEALDSGAIQTESPDPEYETLHDHHGVPAVETTVAIPLDSESSSVLHLYTDGAVAADPLAILRDVIVTGLQRARLASELAREQERLEELRGVVSHDMGNPLNLAAGRLDLVRTECDSEHIEHVENGLEQLEALADEGTTFVTVGREVTEREALSLDEVANDCWKYAGSKRGMLDVEDTTIEADPERLRRILNELIRNVFAHTHGAVTVEMGPLDDAAGFYVADDGPGIPADEREYVFDRGYTTADEHDGNGLAIVEEIAQAHGWTVELADTTGTRIEIKTERW